MRLRQLGVNAPGAAQVELDVVLGMIPDLMARVPHLARQLGEQAHMLPHHEESRRHSLGSERLENRGRRALVGAVVERQIETTTSIAGTTFD